MPVRFEAYFFSLLAFALLFSDAAGQTLPNQSVKFDVPAALAVSVEPIDFTSDASFADQLLQVVIPVSTELQPQSKHSIDTFRFDVFWNQTAYPVFDYLPRTQTISNIQGEIATETTQESKSSLGLSLNADFQSLVGGKTSAESGSIDSVRKKFKHLPDQSILVASGTSHRGTGVFFRFHRSSQTVLEGGRDLMVQFQVPHNWRAGVLRINCFAMGTTSIIGSWENPFEASRTFVIPIYRLGDPEAKTAALDFVNAEQRFRQAWRSYETSKSKSKPLPFSTFLVSTSGSGSKLPLQWAHLLIQTGNDDYLAKYRSRLPMTLKASADDFVAARQALRGLR